MCWHDSFDANLFQLPPSGSRTNPPFEKLKFPLFSCKSRFGRFSIVQEALRRKKEMGRPVPLFSLSKIVHTT